MKPWPSCWSSFCSATGDGRDAYFDAEQNALIAQNAERYYRTMIRGGPTSWNVRDHHMLAHERSDVALVRVSAEGDGAEVPTRKKQSVSALAETGVPEQTFVYEVRRGVSRITGGIARL